MIKMKSIVIIVFFLVALSFSPAIAGEKEVKVKFSGELGGKTVKKVGVKTICVDGYKYIVAVTYQGVSITQSFRLSPDGSAAIPVMCK